MTNSFQVEDKIFQVLPNLKVLVAIIPGIKSQNVQAAKCSELLDEAWRRVPLETSPFPNVQSHPRIALWRQAYLNLKISVKKFTSSIENLAKRAAKPDSKPLHINPLVDFYNALSLKFMVPFGGFDMDTTQVCKNLQLRFTKGGDKFTALDSEEAIELQEGEAVYAYENIVVTRHINWKQSKEGLIEANSSNIILMAELLDSSFIEEMIADLTKSSIEFLGANPEFFIVSKENSSIVF